MWLSYFPGSFASPEGNAAEMSVPGEPAGVVGQNVRTPSSRGWGQAILAGKINPADLIFPGRIFRFERPSRATENCRAIFPGFHFRF